MVPPVTVDLAVPLAVELRNRCRIDDQDIARREHGQSATTIDAGLYGKAPVTKGLVRSPAGSKARQRGLVGLTPANGYQRRAGQDITAIGLAVRVDQNGSSHIR